MTTFGVVLPLAAALAVLLAARAARRGPGRAAPTAADRSAHRGTRTMLGSMTLLWSMLVLGPGLTAIAAVALLGSHLVRRRARGRRVRLDRDQAVPELVDLFRLAASAGQPVATALHTVAARAPRPLRPAAENACAHLRAGGSVADALAHLGAGLGPSGAELVAALVDAARSGTALLPVLDRVAHTARNRRTRAAEEAARRLPVTLLFPLAGCVLPAAVLLAVVPVLAASLSSLSS